MTDATTSEQPVISAAIIISPAKLLGVQRRVSEGALSWQFPAGTVESGETFEEAAARETKEETGIVVTPDRVLGERTHPKTGRRMAYVACTVVSGDAFVADDDELSQVAWASIDELDSYVPYGFAPVVQDHLNASMT